MTAVGILNVFEVFTVMGFALLGLYRLLTLIERKWGRKGGAVAVAILATIAIIDHLLKS